MTQSAPPTVSPAENLIPVLDKKAAGRADIAARCARLAVDYTTAAYGKTGGARAIDALLDGAAYLNAAHHLLTDRTHEGEPVADGPGPRDGDPVVEARRYVRTALLFADHLFAKRPVQPPAWEVASRNRTATACVLTTLAVERLQHALTQLAGLQNGGRPATTPVGMR